VPEGKQKQGYTIPAGKGACPWCGGVTKADLTFVLGQQLKCECGGVWEMIRPPDHSKKVYSPAIPAKRLAE